MSAVRSYSLSIGIIGLPNCGKSTIFNALTKSSVPAENYPFCTIDKNVGVVNIPDDFLDQIAQIYNSRTKIYSSIKFVDVAGLVKGASKGEGLGNKFLSHIRETDALMYILRAFENPNVSHVYNKIDPIEELDIVRTELLLKDVETAQKALGALENNLKSGGNELLKKKVKLLCEILDSLKKGIPIAYLNLSPDQTELIKEFSFLTQKPSFYILNIDSQKNEKSKKWKKALQEKLPEKEKNFVLLVDCKTEYELNMLDEKSKEEYIETIKDYKGVNDIIKMGCGLLNLITFYTVNENEAHSWVVKNGITAIEAGGVVHTDFMKRFISAEVISVEDFIKYNGWKNAKEKGKVRLEGKNYIVKDRECINIIIGGE